MWSHLALDSDCFATNENGNFSHCEFVDACLPQGLSVAPFNSVNGRSEVHPPMKYSPTNGDVVINSVEKANNDQWDRCLKQIIEPLGFGGEEKEKRNSWCNFTHLGQCSYAGVYQPSLPNEHTQYGQFILIGGYVHVFRALGFSADKFSLYELRDKASEICSTSHSDLMTQFELRDRKAGVQSLNDIDVEAAATVEQLCFLSAYSFAILHHGHGFELERNFSVMETMEYGGAMLKVGWQLGAILYEINALPWTYTPDDTLMATEDKEDAESLKQSPNQTVPLNGLLFTLIALCTFVFVVKMQRKPTTVVSKASIDLPRYQPSSTPPICIK